MPRQIVQQDGSSIEVPTDEELTALKTKAGQADTLATDIATLKAQKEAMENDPVNKNFRELRTINERLTTALKAQGKTVKEDGTILDEKPPLTGEEIEAKAEKSARKVIVEERRNSALAKFDTEKRKVVEHFYNKLTQGEEVTTENIDKFVDQAHLLADPNAAAAKKKAPVHVNGGAPRFQNNNDDKGFGDTDAGKAVADELFGALSYTKKKS